MKRILCTLLLALAATGAEADSGAGVVEKADGFSLRLPEDWTAQRERMGVPLLARPDRSLDPEGWGSDLITVTRETVDRQRSCLEGYGYRKLEQLSYHSARFAKLAQEDLTLAGKPATLYTLRYTEGPRELMAYVLILADGAQMLTATALSSPARFEQRRAMFRYALESLRPR